MVCFTARRNGIDIARSEWKRDGKVSIDGQLDQPVALCRDHGGTPAPLHIFPNEVSVIAFVGQQYLGRRPVRVHDRQIAFVIGDFTAGQREGYGQAQRINAEMDLGRKSTF